MSEAVIELWPTQCLIYVRVIHSTVPIDARPPSADPLWEPQCPSIIIIVPGRARVPVVQLARSALISINS